MQIEFLSKTEKKKIDAILSEKYGIDKFNFLILKSGKEKLRIFSGEVGKDEIIKLSRIINIENLGLYFGFFKNDELRLTIDALHLLKPEKNILELDDEQAEKWMMGEDLNKEDIKTDKMEGFVIIKNKQDILGSGKITDKKILNFLPKERRAR